MTGGAKRGVANPWLFEEPEETRGLGFDEIRQQQQKIIQGTEYPRSMGPETLSEFYCSLWMFLTPIEDHQESCWSFKALDDFVP